MEDLNKNKSLKNDKDCIITPLSGKLCYPKSSLLKSLNEYRKLVKNDICEVKDPCILSKDGLVLPDAVPNIVNIPPTWIEYGNEKQIVSCDYWNTITPDIWSEDISKHYTNTSNYKDNTVTVPEHSFTGYVIVNDPDHLTESETEQKNNLISQLNETAFLYGLTLLECRLENTYTEIKCKEVDNDVVVLDNDNSAYLSDGEIALNILDYYNEDTDDDGNIISRVDNSITNDIIESSVQSLSSRLTCTYYNNDIYVSCPDLKSCQYPDDIVKVYYYANVYGINDYSSVENNTYLLNYRTYELSLNINQNLVQKDEDEYITFSDLDDTISNVKNIAADSIITSVVDDVNTNSVCVYQNETINVYCNKDPNIDINPFYFPYKDESGNESVIQTIFPGSYLTYLYANTFNSSGDETQRGLIPASLDSISTNYVFDFDNTNNFVYNIFESLTNQIDEEINSVKNQTCYITNNKITVYCDKILIPSDAKYVYNYDQYIDPDSELHDSSKYIDEGIHLYINDYKILHKSSCSPDTNNTTIQYDAYVNCKYDSELNHELKDEVIEYYIACKGSSPCELPSSECNFVPTSLGDGVLTKISKDIIINAASIYQYTIDNDLIRKPLQPGNEYSNTTLQREANIEAAKTARSAVTCLYGNRYISEEECVDIQLYVTACASYSGIAEEYGVSAPIIPQNTHFSDTPYGADDSAYTAHIAYAVCYCNDVVGGGGGGNSIDVSVANECNECKNLCVLL